MMSATDQMKLALSLKLFIWTVAYFAKMQSKENLTRGEALAVNIDFHPNLTETNGLWIQR
jgi:hypothetical protein